MIEVTVSVDTSKFDRWAADFPDRMAKAQKKALMDIGQAVVSRATQAFRHAPLRPSPWAPRKKLGDGHPLLIKSGTLRQSIDWKLEGDDTVAIGSSQKYATYHQTGTKHMPARPFFPIDASGRLVPAMESKIVKIVEDSLRKEFEK